MRGLLAASLALVVGAAPVCAQAPAQPAAAGQPAIAPPSAPAQTQPAQAQPAQPPAPFPQGAKFAFVNLQGIFQLSAEGKAAATKVQALTQKKQVELADRNKALLAAQQKLQSGGSVMSDQARGLLEKDIERQARELERLQQDAQAELNELQQDLQGQFQTKLFPLLEQLSVEKQLQMLFSAQDAGLIWAEPGLDLTLDAVKKLDAATAK